MNTKKIKDFLAFNFQKRRKLNTKAILMREVLKMVITVAGLIILIILAVGLYGIFTSKSDLEQAKASMDEINAKIDSLETKEQVLITSPVKWVLTTNQNKLCLCDKKYIGDKSECCLRGANKDVGKIIISEGCEPGWTKDYANCIYFEKLPINLYLKKENEKILISSIENE